MTQLDQSRFLRDGTDQRVRDLIRSQCNASLCKCCVHALDLFFAVIGDTDSFDQARIMSICQGVGCGCIGVSGGIYWQRHQTYQLLRFQLDGWQRESGINPLEMCLVEPRNPSGQTTAHRGTGCDGHEESTLWQSLASPCLAPSSPFENGRFLSRTRHRHRLRPCRRRECLAQTPYQKPPWRPFQPRASSSTLGMDMQR